MVLIGVHHRLIKGWHASSRQTDRPTDRPTFKVVRLMIVSHSGPSRTIPPLHPTQCNSSA